MFQEMKGEVFRASVAIEGTSDNSGTANRNQGRLTVRVQTRGTHPSGTE